jgi:chromosome partitioning protein
MWTLALVSQKGGSGKTTLAVHLAVAAAQAGERVVLLDTDPQASARAWAQVRCQPQPLVLGTTPAALSQQLATLDATLVVIDTAPHTAVMLPTVAAVATALLLPCRPTAFDLAAIPATVALARAAHKPTAFVLTACPPRAPEVAEAQAALATHGMPVAPVRIGERRAYARAVAGGSAVTEFEPHGKAAQEITALWWWVQKQLLSIQGAHG